MEEFELELSVFPRMDYSDRLDSEHEKRRHDGNLIHQDRSAMASLPEKAITGTFAKSSPYREG